MPTDTKMQRAVPEQTTAVPAAISRAAGVVRDALLACARRARMPQRDRYVENLRRKTTTGRLLLGVHEMAITYNAVIRGAPREDVKAWLVAAEQTIDVWCDARDGRCVSVDLDALCRAETEAQGAADVSEWDLRFPSAKTLADADERLTQHLDALTRLRDGVRRVRYAGAVEAVA